MPQRSAPLGLTVGRALVVAGPPAVGKSTLLQALRDGEAMSVLPPALLDVGDWQCSGLTGLRDLGRRNAGRLENLALHADLSQLAMPRGQRLPRLRVLLGLAVEIHVVTLWAPPQVLVERLERRRSLRSTRPAPAVDRPAAAHRERMKRELVADAAALDRLYETWFALTADLPLSTSRMVDASTHPLVVMRAPRRTGTQPEM